MRVAVVGSGYVGTVTAACLAWLGNDVVGYDNDRGKAAELAAGQLPFHEPGLHDLLRHALDCGRLTFASDPTAVSGREIVFLCVGTPPGPEGIPDLSQIETAVAGLVPNLSPGVVIVNKSTVPVGSGNWVRTLVEEASEGRKLQFAVVSNPEFLREGSAVADFLHPDRVVLGGNNGSLERVAELYAPVLTQSFAGGRSDVSPRLFVTDLQSAEMIKYAANAFLATKISFANEIAALCELTGADARQVLPAIGADGRIGERFLSPGVGWGGSCFGKDIAALVATGRDYGYPSRLLNATIDVNRSMRDAVIQKLQHELKVLKGRRITLLGLAFKPHTDDLRDAPAVELARKLQQRGCVVSFHDPVVKDAPRELVDVRSGTDPYDAAMRSDAVVLTTEWPEYRQIDPSTLRLAMAGNLVIDGRNFLDTSALTEAGLKVIGVGW